MYDDYDHYDDCDDDDYEYIEDEIVDCDWSGEDQLCDSAGSEHCSFFCVNYRLMLATLTKNAKPPRWAEHMDKTETDDNIPF